MKKIFFLTSIFSFILLVMHFQSGFSQVTQEWVERYNGQADLSDYAISNFVDHLGKIITLVNEKLSPGTYEVEFDREGLPSGIYLYRLEAGEFSETKRMLLIK